MVQVRADLTHAQHAGHAPAPDHGEMAWPGNPGQQPPPPQQSDDVGGGGGAGSGVMSREEHAQRIKELNVKRGITRTPRRGWSMTEYQGDGSAPLPPHTYTTFERRQASIPENAPLPSSAASSSSSTTPAPSLCGTPEPEVTQMPPRPRAVPPPPRRSYSVTDYEPPPPNQPQPSSRMTLVDLPSELHYLVFDHLDPIDSVCFGLAHPRLYAVHRRLNPRPVPLSSRYSGPNDMEWAWRGAGPLVRPKKPSPTPSYSSSSSSSSASSSPSTSSPSTPTTDVDPARDVARMRVRGQVYCRKCGVSRCELHRHLRGWFPGREYCEIKEVYGPPAPADAKPYCYMSSPKNPQRCGRHGGGKGVKAA